MSRPRGIALKLSDLPRLRDLADCHRSMVERVDRWRKPERNAGMQIAYGLVRDQLTQELRWIRSEIARLEDQRRLGRGAP